jgi:ABC-2 type transport system permease protein
MNAFLNHFSFEFRTGVRNRSLLFLFYLFPLMVYFLIGALMTAVNPTFGETLIPAMALFAVLSGTMLSLPDPLVTARNAGIFRSYKINGVPAVSILVITALSALFHLFLIGVFITLTAPAFFKAPLPVNWPAYILVFFLSVLAFAGLGLLVGVVSPSSQMTILGSQVIFLPSMILGGLMLPVSILPPALGKIALLLPTTYAMNAFRGMAMNLPADFNPAWSLLILLAGAILAFGLALSLFTWDPGDPRLRKRAPLALIALLPYLIGMILLP